MTAASPWGISTTALAMNVAITRMTTAMRINVAMSMLLYPSCYFVSFHTTAVVPSIVTTLTRSPTEKLWAGSRLRADQILPSRRTWPAWAPTGSKTSAVAPVRAAGLVSSAGAWVRWRRSSGFKNRSSPKDMRAKMMSSMLSGTWNIATPAVASAARPNMRKVSSPAASSRPMSAIPAINHISAPTAPKLTVNPLSSVLGW